MVGEEQYLELERAKAQDDEAELRQIDEARRDPAAFAPLYAAYFDAIYRYCYLRLHHRELAADATGQTFLKALLGIGGFRSGSFKSWLYAIARNVTTDMLRASRPQVSLIHAESLHDNAPTPEEQALRGDDHDRLWRALQHLTDEQREVLELRLAGLSGAEIASTTRRSLSATKSIQFRALSRLRTVLKSESDSWTILNSDGGTNL